MLLTVPPIAALPWAPGAWFVDTYNQQLRDEVFPELLVEGISVSLVDVARVLTLEHVPDGVHPSEQGHKIIANAIYEEMENILSSFWQVDTNPPAPPPFYQPPVFPPPSPSPNL